MKFGQVAAAAAALFAVLAIVIGFVELTTQILTFDPTALNGAVQGMVKESLAQVGLPQTAIQVQFPDGGIQQAGYLDSWASGGVPLVQNYLDTASVQQDPNGTLEAPPHSLEFAPPLTILLTGNSTPITKNFSLRAELLANVIGGNVYAWSTGLNDYAGLESFAPYPAGQLLVSGLAIEIVVLLGLVYVLLKGCNTGPVALGVLFLLSLTAMAVLFGSAGVMHKCLEPFADLLEGYTPIIGGLGVEGFQSINVDGNVYYAIASGFVAETWLVPAFALVLMLLCVAVVVKHPQTRRRTKGETQLDDLDPSPRTV